MNGFDADQETPQNRLRWSVKLQYGLVVPQFVLAALYLLFDDAVGIIYTQSLVLLVGLAVSIFELVLRHKSLSANQAFAQLAFYGAFAIFVLAAFRFSDPILGIFSVFLWAAYALTFIAAAQFAHEPVDAGTAYKRKILLIGFVVQIAAQVVAYIVEACALVADIPAWGPIHVTLLVVQLLLSMILGYAALLASGSVIMKTNLRQDAWAAGFLAVQPWAHFAYSVNCLLDIFYIDAYSPNVLLPFVWATDVFLLLNMVTLINNHLDVGHKPPPIAVHRQDAEEPLPDFEIEFESESTKDDKNE